MILGPILFGVLFALIFGTRVGWVLIVIPALLYVGWCMVDPGRPGSITGPPSCWLSEQPSGEYAADGSTIYEDVPVTHNHLPCPPDGVVVP